MQHIGRESGFCSQVVLPTAWKGPKNHFLTVLCPFVCQPPVVLSTSTPPPKPTTHSAAPSLPASKVYFGDATVHSTSTVHHPTTRHPIGGIPERIIPLHTAPHEGIPLDILPPSQRRVSHRTLSHRRVPYKTSSHRRLSYRKSPPRRPVHRKVPTIHHQTPWLNPQSTKRRGPTSPPTLMLTRTFLVASTTTTWTSSPPRRQFWSSSVSKDTSFPLWLSTTF